MTQGEGTTAGRAGFGPLLLALPVFLGTLVVLWLMPRGRSEWANFEVVDEADVPDLDEVAPEQVDGWEGELLLDDGTRLVVRLSPFESLPRQQTFRSHSLRDRLGLPDGELWRAEVKRLPGDAASAGDVVAPLLTGLEVGDEMGVALQPVLDVATPAAEAPVDPIRALYALSATPLASGDSVQAALWGRAPGPGAELRFEGGRRTLTLAPATLSTATLPRSFVVAAPPGEDASPSAADESTAVATEDPRDAEIADLRARLAAAIRSRQERELAWYEYNRVLADLDIDQIVGTFAVDEEFVPDEVADEEQLPAEEEADVSARRAGEILISIKNLMRLEEVVGLDLLEVGTLGARGVGPAIFRTLDDRGRLTGSMHADLLRLEGSRAARTLTLVLDGGFESRGGVRTPFDGDERRIVFPFVDPEPWMAELPELFSQAELHPINDDGRWKREPLREEVNRLLGLDTSTGLYRVWGIGGVLGEQFVDVQIEHYDSDGHLQERYFADRMRILLEPPGVLLLLEGGAIMRGGRKSAFLEGKHRIFLPRTPLDDWRAAHLPGWGAPPPASREASGDGG